MCTLACIRERERGFGEASYAGRSCQGSLDTRLYYFHSWTLTGPERRTGTSQPPSAGRGFQVCSSPSKQRASIIVSLRASCPGERIPHLLQPLSSPPLVPLIQFRNHCSLAPPDACGTVPLPFSLLPVSLLPAAQEGGVGFSEREARMPTRPCQEPAWAGGMKGQASHLVTTLPVGACSRRLQGTAEGPPDPDSRRLFLE